MNLTFVTRILISTTMASVLFIAVSGHSTLASEKEIKKKQIKKLEKELSREKEKFLEFGIKEKNLLGQLSALEKRIDEKKGLLECFR